jgi:hypothetical protein
LKRLDAITIQVDQEIVLKGWVDVEGIERASRDESAARTGDVHASAREANSVVVLEALLGHQYA